MAPPRFEHGPRIPHGNLRPAAPAVLPFLLVLAAASTTGCVSKRDSTKSTNGTASGSTTGTATTQGPAPAPPLKKDLVAHIDLVLARVDAKLTALATTPGAADLVFALQLDKQDLTVLKTEVAAKGNDGEPVAPAHAASAALMIPRAEGHLETQRVGARQFLPSPWFRTHAGAATISPYVLSPTGPDGRFELESVDNSLATYVEFDYLHRRAWLEPEQIAAPNRPRDHWWADDLEVRLRFVDQDGTSQIDSTTEAAQGDWGLETSLGWVLSNFGSDEVLQARATDAIRTKPRGTVNAELNFGGSTDREALDARVFAQVGLAGAWAFPMEFADGKWRSATVFIGTYYGVHPYPRLDTDDVVYSTAPRPHFNELGSLGIKVDFTLPLTERMEVVLGGRYASALGSDVPENWQIFVGLSVPIGRLVRDLLGAETK